MTCLSRFTRQIVIVFAALALLAVPSARCASPGKPPEHTAGAWSLTVLPDTQMYSEKYPGLFTLQTHWIAKNKAKYDIRYVLQLGDVTNGDRRWEWKRARDAFAELDGVVPYAMVPGNHDYTPSGDASGKSGINEFFPPSKFKNWPTFGGVMRSDEIANSYHLFHAGNADWIVLALEWAPRDETVKWANEILAKHPDRRAILITHAYLYTDNARYDFEAKKKSQKWNPHAYKSAASMNDGEELWQKLVRKNNVALVINGHVCDSGVGFLSSKNDRGKTTHQMLVNYQMRKLGGEGYLRLLEFLPDGRTVRVQSYSPLYDKQLDDPAQQFSLELDP